MQVARFFSSKAYEYLLVVRNAFILMFPMYLLSSIVLFAAAMGDFFGYGYYADLLKNIHKNLVLVLPTLLTLCISYFQVIHYKLPPIHVAVAVSIFYQVVMVVLGDGGLMVGYFLACVTPFATIPLIHYFYQKSWGGFSQEGNVSKILEESFKLILPILVLTTLFLLFYFGVAVLDIFPRLRIDFTPYIADLALGHYLYAFANSLFWWIGFHGGMLMEGFAPLLAQSTGVSLVKINNILHAFVFIGGSGATLSLIIAILLKSSHPKQRTVALSGLPFSFLNINEIILYGLPLIFNPRLLIPFLVVPALNIFFINLAIKYHVITFSNYELTFSTFIFFNSYLATNEGFLAVFLQLLLIGVGTLVYMPFVQKSPLEGKVVEFSSLNTQFIDRTKEVIFKTDDTIKIQALLEEKNRQLVEHLERISNYNYMLYFQPQISSLTGRVTGCEALIRAQNSQGEILFPGDFLPWFHKANMSKSIDSWVLEEAYKHTKIFKKQGLHVPISVNISSRTIQDPEFLAFALSVIKKSEHMLNIELTEDGLAEDDVAEVLSQFKEKGAQNYVDDFGTGFSSLSYLYRLPLDGIKIDRSFVVALSCEKGRSLFEGLLLFGERMGLKIIVEGVETQEQLDYLHQLRGEFYIQGWYYSKAQDAQSFISFTKKRTAL